MKPLLFYGPNPSTAEMGAWFLRETLAHQPDFAPVFIDSESAPKAFQDAIVIGYSWGAYRAIRDLIAAPQSNPAQVVLIAPFFEPAEPLSPFLFHLLNTSVPGGLLMRFATGRIRSDFFNKNFPLTRGANLDPLLQHCFNEPATWRRALRTKYEQQRHPLDPSACTDRLRCPIIIVHFSGDSVATAPARAGRLVAGLFETPVRAVTWEGFEHGALWSQTAQLIDKVRELIQPDRRVAPGEITQNNVISFLERHAEDFPEKIALEWAQPGALRGWDHRASTAVRHEQISFRALNTRIARLASGLSSLGIKKRDRVMVFLPMSLDMYTAMFAVQRLGAIAVFLDSWARSHHLGASAACVQPKAMISFERAFQLVDRTPEFDAMPIRILCGPGQPSKSVARFEELLQSTKEAPIAPVAREHPALITFTTGSSGTPKGANRTHRFLAAQHEALDRIIPYNEPDRDLPAFPIFSLNNLAAGVTTVLPALDLAMPADHDAALLVSQIVSQQVTCATLSPSMFSNVAQHCAQENVSLPGLRRVVTGGAPITKDAVRAFSAIAPNATVLVLYGSTEAEPIAHIEGRQLLETNESGRGDRDLLEEGVCVGRISEDLRYKFIKIERGPIVLQGTCWAELEVARGEIGELIVAGDHVCRDYYNNTEAFRRAKIEDTDGSIWHRTGDLGYLDPRNRLWVVGRVHNVIERAGRYLFPVRPETLLKRVDGVRQSAFLGLPDSRLRERTVAVVVISQGADRRQVRERIASVFARNRIPVDELLEIDAIPTDPRHHSKVEYAELKEQLLHGLARPL